MFVRQFLALVIFYGAVVMDVEKIPGHLNEMRKFELGSGVRYRTDRASVPTLFLDAQLINQWSRGRYDDTSPL
jgi:hypothetical protein